MSEEGLRGGSAVGGGGTKGLLLFPPGGESVKVRGAGRVRCWYRAPPSGPVPASPTSTRSQSEWLCRSPAAFLLSSQRFNPLMSHFLRTQR